MEIFIVIPCYNEEKKIKEVLERINNLKLDKNIIVVDDGSFDGSCSIMENNFKDVFLLKHKINLGKGAALKTGCEAAVKLGADIIVLMDADGQHSPEVIPEMVKKLETENLDVVFGVREINIKKMPLSSFFGNIFLTQAANFILRTKIKDALSGFRAFRSSVYEKILWDSSGYYVETEINLKMARNNLKYGHVFIDTIYYDAYKGTSLFDGVKIFFNLLKQKFL